jgi:hypothetical protein
MRQLSEAHKARLAEGRRKRSEALRRAGAMRAARFSEWSENLASGKATMSECPFDPNLASDDDFDYARELGLIQ